MNQKSNPMVNGRPIAPINSPKWPTRPSLLSKAGSPIFTSSPPVKTGQKNVPFSPGARTNDSAKDITTPVKSFLNSNITPRSSSRKARKGSQSSTPNGSPNGTPVSSRPVSLIEQMEPRIVDSSQGKIGLGIRSKTAGGASKASSVVSDGQKSHRPFRPTSGDKSLYGTAKTKSPESQPMFFRADDVRPSLQRIPSERCMLEGKTAGIKGSCVEDESGTGICSLSISPPLEAPRPKFFYANGTAESTTSATKLATRATGKSPAVAAQPPQRATSPLKDELLSRESSLSIPSPIHHAHPVSNTAKSRDQDFRVPEPLSAGQPILSRRSSLSTQSQQCASHVKSSSVSAVGSNSIRRPSIALSDGPFMVSSNFHPTVEARAATNAHLPSPSISNLPHPKSPITLTSPSVGPSKLENANELAADARRERKVLDLEISNSSLLAINRTLEREMRKQQAELRRLRRQSQFGRLSAKGSSRFNSKKMSMLSENDDHTNSDHISGQSSPALSIEESDDDRDEDNDNDSDSKLSSSSNNSLPDGTPSSLSHDALKSSKRLSTEYSRHRALLIEGQKMNQSIERCLGRTEDLIAAGRKALEYRVDVHELENRIGRVLLPDELEEMGMWGPRQGLLSPGTGSKEMAWEEEGDGQGTSRNTEQDDEFMKIEAYARPSLEEGEIFPRFEEGSQGERSVAEPESETDSKNGWDSIKADVQTPDDISSAGVQGLRDYISTLKKTAVDII